MSIVIIINSTISPWTKWPPFHRQHFQMHFHEWKFLYFDSNFTEVCSQGVNRQKVSVGSGNGLAPNRRQAIIWTNADPGLWRKYAALGGDMLSAALSFLLCVWAPREGVSWLAARYNYWLARSRAKGQQVAGQLRPRQLRDIHRMIGKCFLHYCTFVREIHR